MIKNLVSILGLLSLTSMFVGTAFALLFFGFAMALKVFVASALLVLFFLLIYK